MLPSSALFLAHGKLLVCLPLLWLRFLVTADTHRLWRNCLLYHSKSFLYYLAQIAIWICFFDVVGSSCFLNMLKALMPRLCPHLVCFVILTSSFWNWVNFWQHPIGHLCLPPRAPGQCFGFSSFMTGSLGCRFSYPSRCWRRMICFCRLPSCHTSIFASAFSQE